jgi:serine/threonine-protein kinase RsbW
MAPEQMESMPYAAVTDLPGLREFVCARAMSLGLPPARAEMLQLAVSELATNTLLYTVAGGHVRVWVEAGQLVCEVLDQGPAPRFGRAMPPPEAERGRGLPIVELVCDAVSTAIAPGGTAVRLRFNL